MDLFFQHVPIPTRRRIHFNAAMLHINASLAALERERAAQEANQAAAYAARVASARDAPWALLRRHDPEYEKQRRARLARMAVRREQRERQTRSAEQHLSRLAGACTAAPSEKSPLSSNVITTTRSIQLAALAACSCCLGAWRAPQQSAAGTAAAAQGRQLLVL